MDTIRLFGLHHEADCTHECYHCVEDGALVGLKTSGSLTHCVGALELITRLTMMQHREVLRCVIFTPRDAS